MRWSEGREFPCLAKEARHGAPIKVFYSWYPDNLFLGARLGRDEAGDAVVDDELAIVLAGMLDEGVGRVIDAVLLVLEGIDDHVGHSLIAFCFDGGRAVGG